MTYNYLFGPVPSRRLGLSLGVDIVPHKTCSLDCVYCECGATTTLTVRPRALVNAEAVIGELADFLSPGPALDHVTFSGGGEPTLNTGLGDILHYLKTAHPLYKTALLTNGTLFYDPDVRKNAMMADVIVASVDAADDETFARINRPHPGLSLTRIFDGLRAFRKAYTGSFWVEVFIVPGINDDPTSLEAISAQVDALTPDKVQINTLDRPGTCDWVRPADRDALDRAKSLIRCVQEIPEPSRAVFSGKEPEDLEVRVLAALARRPLTLSDIEKALNLNDNAARGLMHRLEKKGSVVRSGHERGDFFRLAR